MNLCIQELKLLALQSGAQTIAPQRDPNTYPIPSNPSHLLASQSNAHTIAPHRDPIHPSHPSHLLAPQSSEPQFRHLNHNPDIRTQLKKRSKTMFPSEK